MKHGKYLIQLILIFFLLTALCLDHEGAEKRLIDHGIRTDQALYVSAKAVLRQFDQKAVTLIDVRDKKAFGRFHIPGALSIPLYFIRTKPFLKPMQLVIIHAGMPSRQLEQAVMTLHREGFRAKILMGGLNAWMQKKGPIKGDRIAARSVSWITPAIFHQDRWDDHHMIIDISPTPKRGSTKGDANIKHLPLKKSEKGWLDQFSTHLKSQQKEAFRDVWIIGEDTRAYRTVRRLINDKLEIPVFYLQGGLSAYTAYQKKHALSLKPAKDRVKTSADCPTCNTDQ